MGYQGSIFYFKSQHAGPHKITIYYFIYIEDKSTKPGPPRGPINLGFDIKYNYIKQKYSLLCTIQHIKHEHLFTLGLPDLVKLSQLFEKCFYIFKYHSISIQFLYNTPPWCGRVGTMQYSSPAGVTDCGIKRYGGQAMALVIYSQSHDWVAPGYIIHIFRAHAYSIKAPAVQPAPQSNMHERGTRADPSH